MKSIKKNKVRSRKNKARSRKIKNVKYVLPVHQQNTKDIASAVSYTHSQKNQYLQIIKQRNDL